VAYLLAVGDLVIGWLLLLHAEIALNALDSDPSDRDRGSTPEGSRGKLFAKNVLPRLTAERKIVKVST
jgi:hypothetical protein